LFVW
jgi:hypothetical protein